MGDTMATQKAYVQVKDLKKHYGDGDARLTVLGLGQVDVS